MLTGCKDKKISQYTEDDQAVETALNRNYNCCK